MPKRGDELPHIRFLCELLFPIFKFSTLLEVITSYLKSFYFSFTAASLWPLGQPVLASILSKELQYFAGAKFFCSHALAGNN